jgi:ABC-type bacteriocin/lantibiotic exporter with double-glycine peptidase domain
VALFSRYRATYFQLLAAGLLGKVAGLLILLVADLMFHEQIAVHQQPQRMWTIPVYTMLLGLIVGTLRTWRATHRKRS